MANIQFVPAVRDRTRLIIGLAGYTGSGKTRSALELARGLAGGDDSKIKAIDTENGRLLFFAPAKGQKPGKGTFGFLHGEMHAPFSPMAYLEALEGFRTECEVGIIDSFSHEWSGEGGQHDMQTEALERMMAKNPNLSEESVSSLAWKTPKMEHRRLVNALGQLPCFLIVCLRAEEKLRIERVPVNPDEPEGRKKTVFIQPADLPIAKRWGIDCEKKFPFELSMSLLVTPDNPGVPIPLKLNDEHKHLIPLDRQLSEGTGRAIREWSYGGVAVTAPASRNNGADMPAAWAEWTTEERATNRANGGLAAFRAYWKTLSPDERVSLQPRIGELQAIAEKAS
jgi:hypothetical protein